MTRRRDGGNNVAAPQQGQPGHARLTRSSVSTRSVSHPHSQPYSAGLLRRPHVRSLAAPPSRARHCIGPERSVSWLIIGKSRTLAWSSRHEGEDGSLHGGMQGKEPGSVSASTAYKIVSSNNLTKRGCCQSRGFRRTLDETGCRNRNCHTRGMLTLRTLWYACDAARWSQGMTLENAAALDRCRDSYTACSILGVDGG